MSRPNIYPEDQAALLGTADFIRLVTAKSGFTLAASVEVVSVETGQVTLRMPRKPELLQFNGFFHGGAIAGLADHAAGAAATSAFPAGVTAVTVDLHINYLKPANGSSITATAKVASAGSTLSVVTLEVFSERSIGSRYLCAVGTATLRAVKPPALEQDPSST